MYFEINSSNEILFYNKKYKSIELDNNKLNIYGDFLCLFQNKKFLKETESLEILRSSLKDLNKLQKNILDTIGACQFVLRRSNGDIIIYNSNESPGIFYGKDNKKLYISTSEIDISRKLIKNKINNFELVDYLFRHYNKKNSFRSLIDGVMRLPTSYSLRVENDLTLSSECFSPLNNYCSDKRSLKELDSDFKFYLEETINYYYNKKGNLKLYSDLSAGIDSTVVTIACKKKKFKCNCFSSYQR